MKNFYLNTLILSLSLFGVWSCSDSRDEKEYVSLVTVVENAQNEKLLMRGDSSLLKPENMSITSPVGQRILIEYEIKRTHDTNTPYRYEVKIEDFDIILTKNVVDLSAANEAEIGNDAYFNIYDMNAGGGFLNVYLSFLYNYVPHYVNLVANEITPPANSVDSINLELRQNANGPNIGYPVSELVSFNVQKYIDAAKAADAPELVIVVKVLLPNAVSSSYKVKFKTGAVNDEPKYNKLDAYNPINNAAN